MKNKRHRLKMLWWTLMKGIGGRVYWRMFLLLTVYPLGRRNTFRCRCNDNNYRSVLDLDHWGDRFCSYTRQSSIRHHQPRVSLSCCPFLRCCRVYYSNTSSLASRRRPCPLSTAATSVTKRDHGRRAERLFLPPMVWKSWACMVCRNCVSVRVWLSFLLVSKE